MNAKGLRRFLVLACAVLGLQAGSVTAATLDCPAATTLEQLVDCISQQMPQSGSGGYVAPTISGGDFSEHDQIHSA